MLTKTKKRYALGVAAALTGALLAIGVHWRQERNEIKANAAKQLTAIAELKLEQIVNWRNERLADGRFFSQAPFVAKDVQALLADPQAEPARSDALKWLTLLKGGDRYSQVRIFRPDFTELLSVSSDPDRVPPAVPSEIATAFAAREPQLTDLHRDTDPELHVDVLVPIFATPPSPTDRPIAAITLRLDPRRFLFPLIQEWPLPSATAEAVLAHREGDEVVFVSPLRHRPDSTLGLRFPISTPDLPMAIAMRGGTGLIEGRDYRGIPVLTFVEPVPDSPWFMSAEVDQSEIYAPLHRQALYAGGLALTLALAILGGAGWLWHREETAYLRRELASETERVAGEQRLRTLGDNIPGGAIYQLVAPPGGPVRYDYMSAGIEKIFGLPAECVIADPEKFWELIVGDDRVRIEEAQARSARELTLFDLEFRQRTTSGEVKWVQARSTPRRLEDGTVIWDGVVADITERKRVEEVMKEQLALQERIATIATTVPGVIYTFRLRPDGSASFPYASPAIAEYFGFDASALAIDAAPIFAAMHADDVAEVRASIAESARALSPWSREFRFHHPKKGLIWVVAMSMPRREADGSTLWHGFTMEVTHLRKTEAALRASEDRFRTTLDEMMESCQIVSFDWRYLYLNKAAGTYARQPRESLIGQTMMAAYPGIESTEIFAALRKTMEERVPQKIEAEFTYPDGQRAWFQNHIQPVPEGIFILSLDITDRKQAEEALERERGSLKTLVQTLPDLVWLKDPQGVYLACNRRFEQLYGAPESKIVGRTDFDFTSAEQASFFRENDQAAIHAGRPRVNIEELTFASDGHREWVETIKTPMLDTQGQLIGVLGIARDITTAREAQARITASEERFHELADNVTEIFWITEPDSGRMLYVSPAYEKIWGRSCESAYADPQSWKAAVHPDDVPHLEAARTSAENSDQTYRIRRPDGTERWIHDRAFPVRDVDGEIVRIVGVAEDVTESRQMEAQLRQAQKMEAIGQLAGGVAHDFNNLLSVITVHTDLLTNRLPEGDPTRDSLMDIQRAAERAAALTRQLLVFSRQQVVEPKVLDLNSSVADSEKMLCRLIGEDVHLETRLNPGLSAVKIDPGHLSQVIMNLAVNARDAMPQGGRLTIETHNIELDEEFAQTHAEVKPGPHVLLAVTDTGCGMKPEVLAHIWEPFFTTKGAGRGTGLGLAVVHGIVKQAGGYLSAYSEVGVGTTFKIYLPAVADLAQKSSSRTTSPLTQGSETILLVDDEDAFRNVSAVALRHLGYQVLVADGGQQALKLATTHSGRIDLLLTDVVMPDMGGRPLAEALQARSPDLKVLYQSGYTDDAVVRHGILQAEVSFLQKPFTLATLATKVREVLDH